MTGRPLRQALAVALVAAVVPVVAGCGGKKLVAANAVATTAVDLPPSYRFSPDVITLEAGRTVTWTNHDHFTHSIRFRSGPAAGTHVLKPGQAYRVAFPERGTFRYDCSFHPRDMQGEVIVR